VQAAEAAHLEKLFADDLAPRIAGASHLAIAVSGGSDSTALMFLARTLKKRGNCDVTTITLDHGLRPESATEAHLVSQWSKSIGMPHITLRWEGAKPESGIQAAARKARYDAMTQWCKNAGVQLLLTGHTADDQDETVAMRGARSSSPRSLAGIWPDIDWNGVRVLRPLLNFRRADLRAYLTSIGQGWIDDPSNENMGSERVRVRRNIAGIETRGSEVAAINQAKVLAARVQSIDWMLAHAYHDSLGFIVLKRDEVEQLGIESCKEIIRASMSCIQPSAAPFEREIISLAGWLLLNGRGDGLRRTLGGCLFAKRKDWILVVREWARIAEQAQFIPESGELVWDGRFNLKGPPGDRVEPAGRLQRLVRPEGVPSYVFRGLPAVLSQTEGPILPQFDLNAPVRCDSLALPAHLRFMKSWNPGAGNLC
jgi:tRNA(Ile)-lysidine synthase